MRTAKVQMNLRINLVWFGHSLFVDIYYSIHCQRTTQAQISLCQCAGWSGLSLFAKCIRVIFALRKHALWHMRPTKTHFSLRMREVWSVFVVRMKKLCILGYPKMRSVKILIWQRKCSDWSISSLYVHEFPLTQTFSFMGNVGLFW